MKEADLVVWLRMNSFFLREGKLKTILPYRGGGKNPAYCGVFLFRRTMKEIKKAISKVDSIVITTHKSPDGDAIGSSLALWHYLKSLRKSVVVVVPDAFPEFLNWMEGTESILNYEQDI